MSTACSYNSAIGIKYISYWFTSCFLLAFPSVWSYPISPGVLPGSLAGRMNGLPPLLPFIWLFEGCGCHWALQPLHHWDFWSQCCSDWETGQKWASPSRVWRCSGILAHLWHATQPQLAAFPLALRIWALCWFCRLGQWVGEEPFLSSCPSYSVINPRGVVQNPPLVLFIINTECLFRSIQRLLSMWHLSGIFRFTCSFFGAIFRGFRAGPDDRGAKFISCLALLLKSSMLKNAIVSHLWAHFFSKLLFIMEPFWHSAFSRDTGYFLCFHSYIKARGALVYSSLIETNL